MLNIQKELFWVFFLNKMKIYLIGKAHLLLKHDKFNLKFFRWLKFLFISELLEFIKKILTFFFLFEFLRTPYPFFKNIIITFSVICNAKPLNIFVCFGFVLCVD